MKSTIEKFYSSFQAGDVRSMTDCYHPDIVFEDPAFGVLRGAEAGKMWEMLIARSKGKLEVTFDDISSDGKSGKAKWEARYKFGKQERNIHNKIQATFEFEGEKIIKHTDQFDLWAWASQAMGPVGRLLGWAPFFKRRLQNRTRTLLQKYMRKHP